LKLIELKINKRGTSETLAALRATVIKEIHQLEHPERTEIHEEAQAKRCAEKSDKCSRLMFSSYKQIAKQQHINKVKTTSEWKEGEEPTFTGHTTKPDQVCAELMKYYKMLFSEKKIDEKMIQKILKKFKSKDKQLLPPAVKKLGRTHIQRRNLESHGAPPAREASRTGQNPQRSLQIPPQRLCPQIGKSDRGSDTTGGASSSGPLFVACRCVHGATRHGRWLRRARRWSRVLSLARPRSARVIHRRDATHEPRTEVERRGQFRCRPRRLGVSLTRALAPRSVCRYTQHK
jgi:hypothetical protein